MSGSAGRSGVRFSRRAAAASQGTTPAVEERHGHPLLPGDIVDRHSAVVALEGDGSVRCWGANGYGQLGDGTLTDRLGPVPVAAR